MMLELSEDEIEVLIYAMQCLISEQPSAVSTKERDLLARLQEAADQ